jgi:hypothetical protein
MNDPGNDISHYNHRNGQSATPGRAVGPQVCPSCGQTDQTVKVKSVHAAGSQTSRVTVDGTVRGTPIHATARISTKTRLARRLAPPPSLKSPAPSTAVFLIAAFVILGSVDSLIDGTAADNASWAVVGLIAMIVSGPIAWCRFTQQRQHGPAVADAQARWRASWYCRRCDKTYLPTTPTSTPAATTPPHLTDRKQ